MSHSQSKFREFFETAREEGLGEAVGDLIVTKVIESIGPEKIIKALDATADVIQTVNATRRLATKIKHTFGSSKPLPQLSQLVSRARSSIQPK